MSQRTKFLVALCLLACALAYGSWGLDMLAGPPKRRARPVDDYASRVGDELAEPYRPPPSPAPENGVSE